MDFKCGGGGGAGGSGGGDDFGQGSQGGEGLKRKWNDLEASMKAVKENAEKTAKIRRLMQDSVTLEETGLRDLEASMKAMKHAFVQENAEKPAKIRRLMEDNVRLEETVLRLEDRPFQGPIRPIPGPNQFAVFPPEVWKMIIEKMSRVSDLEMLCLAFPQLEPLVKTTKKTLFLLQNVLPFVREHLKLEDINNCRLVCEKWNQDICALLAKWNAPSLLSETSITHTHPPDYYPSTFLLQDAYEFQNHTKIQKFLMKIVDFPGNPFFGNGRFLRLSVYGETDLKEFWESALELVKKFGEHIWNLEIVYSRQRLNPILIYQAIQQTLTYLPNLRYLAIFVYYDLARHGASKTEMAAQIQSSPLPPLPYLQSFKLNLEHESGMTNVFSSLFSQRIQRLELCGNTFGLVSLKDEWLRELINLEDLEVVLNSANDILRLLKFPSSKLRKLRIHSRNLFRPSISVTLGQFSNLLDTFSRLEYLDQVACNFPLSSSSGIRFPWLKTLRIAVGMDEDDLQRNLDFLLWFPSLKHLEILPENMRETNQNVDSLDQNSVLKLRHYLQTGRMLDSNIWTLIPSLDVLKITYKGKYTREMFENRRG